MQFITGLYSFIMWYIIILDLMYVLLLVASLKSIFLGYIESKVIEVVPTIRDLPLLHPVTVIIPVYNGEDLILESIYSVLNSKGHEKINITIVNDGSTDGTLQKVIETFEMQEINARITDRISVVNKVKKIYLAKHNANIMLIDKENGGKSDALNAGLNLCRTDLFVTLDHDTLVAPDAIFTLMYVFLRNKNAIAIGGSLSILNGCKHKEGKIIEERISKNPLCAIQAVEYLRSFLFGRAGWAELKGSLCYAGAFTLFDYNYVAEIGGFDYKNVAQDFEIITHLQALRSEKHFESRLGFAPGAVAWTSVPDTLKDYWYQRTNWQMGSIHSLILHKNIFFNPKYGVIGFITYPFFLLGEIGCGFIISIGYIIGAICWGIDLVDYYWVSIILLVSFGLSLSLSLATFFLSLITYSRYKGFKAKLGLFFAAILENFGLRQFLVVCEAIATVRYMFGQRPPIVPYA